MDRILSVGIDIGTSTTQLVFSRLHMENTAGSFAVPKAGIVGKEILFRSRIHETPLLSPDRLDGEGIRELVKQEFHRAGFVPGDTDTGAVIITGEAARKENAAVVLEVLSGFAGDFVVSVAGPDLESVIAGMGSGAGRISRERQMVVANLDIGGGTTNIAVFDCGDVIAVGCYDIGGRLVRVDAGSRVSRVSPSARKVAEACGLDIRPGMEADTGTLRRLAEAMARLLETAMGLRPSSRLLDDIRTSGSSALTLKKPVQGIVFSGGVADSVYGELSVEPLEFGDIGVLLGSAVRGGQLPAAFRLLEPEETIRATVVGAGSHTTALSGSTIAYDADVFPLKNLPVVRLSPKEESGLLEGRGEAAADRVSHHREQTDADTVVIAMRGPEDPDYRELKHAAEELARIAARALPAGSPLIVVLEQDAAMALGQMLRQYVAGRCVLALDSIRVEGCDYMDIGRPVLGGMAVPVVVKTLVLSAAAPGRRLPDES